MSQRSTPQRTIDERSWPVRILIYVPKEGFGHLLGLDDEAIHPWLDREIGRTEYTNHSSGRGFIGTAVRDQVAYYFRHPSDAARFLEAFPNLELADGTKDPGYSSPYLPFGRK